MRYLAQIFATLIAVIMGCENTCGQKRTVDTVSNFNVNVWVAKRFYVGSGLDLVMLSTSINKTATRSAYITVPRFTAMVNLGITLNYDINKKFGLFSGVGLANMGFIEKAGDSTIKRRVYSLGIPIGIKFGDLRNRNFVFLGGGVSVPFHYKEKGFVQRRDKQISSEWFSDKTERIMPFVFVGHSWDPGITFKVQYYPVNFFNEDYTDEELPFGTYPYSGYKVNLLLFSLGIDIHYNQYHIQNKEYQQMRKEKEGNKLL